MRIVRVRTNEALRIVRASNIRDEDDMRRGGSADSGFEEASRDEESSRYFALSAALTSAAESARYLARFQGRR